MNTTPFTVMVYLKIDGEIYSEITTDYVIRGESSPNINITGLIESMKEQMKELWKSDDIEIITKREYEMATRGNE